ncbi:hypothetical protein HS088_TW19G00701 [Tripterygium wilfordii]|uniref:rRNA-processing protein EBP2 n=1 Tax=Tripterygium wilfordii TaxID=458696 RepID=A0A7J7CB58_TRIWF|nr:hypothetical protein HS088_TW19G00701 [Tripterygium wilfordii]
MESTLLDEDVMEDDEMEGEAYESEEEEEGDAPEGTRQAFEKLQSMKLPFLRPPDFYADMVKSDAHMEKVSGRFLAEKRNKEAAYERRKDREVQELAKEAVRWNLPLKMGKHLRALIKRGQGQLLEIGLEGRLDKVEKERKAWRINKRRGNLRTQSLDMEGGRA